MLRYLLVLVLFVAPFSALGVTWVQTDWIGGPGVLGPVSDWGAWYWMGDSVTTGNEGQVSLTATDWDYLNWAKHIVESNSGIRPHAQGFMPADIDSDGILDLVAHTADSVVWYRHDGHYGFTKNQIGPAYDGGVDAPCVYPCDLDLDGDIDVLVATGPIGCGWYEHQGSSWTYHILDDSIGYHRISACDVELDNDMDIIAVNNLSGTLHGDIYLFRNNGMSFTKELAVYMPLPNGWRVYPADFNGDGYPDLYSVKSYTYIFINDGTGSFTEAYYYYFSAPQDFDGAWPYDIDMDGDLDLITANQYDNTPGHPYGFYAHLNDGTGWDYVCSLLVSVPNIDYTDGSMAKDLDMDGWPDIAGTRFKVGWFRQDPLNPLTFTLYNIDSSVYESHWIYADRLCDKCTPSMDLLVTEWGTHIVYENQMLRSFASFGFLESSILELVDPSSDPLQLEYLGYGACVPNDSALSFYWRAGADSSELVNSPWTGPYPATVGMGVVDSLPLAPATGRVFQYKAEFRGAPDDIGVLYEVWVEACTLVVGGGLVTGGGWIPGDPPGPGNKRTFGFNVHSEAGAVWGQLQFNDHGTKMKVHSDTIYTLVIQPGDTIADFSGDCRVDGVSGYSFTCEVMDRGEPGHYVDWFGIDIYDANGAPYYTAGDFLGGGNIQIHIQPDGGFTKGKPSSKEGGVSVPDPGRKAGEGRQTAVLQLGLLQIPSSPFIDRATIGFRLPGSGNTTLDICDSSGRLVARLVDGRLSRGAHSVTWECTGTPPGIYFCRLTSGDLVATEKLVVLR